MLKCRANNLRALDDVFPDNERNVGDTLVINELRRLGGIFSKRTTDIADQFQERRSAGSRLSILKRMYG